MADTLISANDGTSSDSSEQTNGETPDRKSSDTPEQPSGDTLERRGPHSPERVRSYEAVAGIYAAGVAAAGLLVARTRHVPPVPAAANRTQAWSDIGLVGLSTYKLSRVLTKQKVTSPLRAPFTEYDGPAGPGEVNVRPVGSGWRRSVGELMSCPFCLGVWIATAGTFGLHLAPRATRFVLATFAAVGLSDLLHFVHVDLEHRAEG
jgi:hypothetical protein